MTSPAVAGLNVLSSPHLPDEGSSGLLMIFFSFFAQCSNSLMYGGSAKIKSYISYEKSAKM